MKKSILKWIILGLVLLVLSLILFWPTLPSRSHMSNRVLERLLSYDIYYEELIKINEEKSEYIHSDLFKGFNAKDFVSDDKGFILDYWDSKLKIFCLNKNKKIYYLYSLGENKEDENGQGDDIKVMFRIYIPEHS